MNSLRKLFGIIFVTTIIAFALASCELSGDLGGTTGGNTGGNEPTTPITPTTPTNPINPTTVAVTGISIKSTTSLVAGGTENLSAVIDPPTATNKNVTWNSGNTSVATVSASGAVTAVAAGSATITVKTADGNKTADCVVTVVTSAVAVTGVTLNKSSTSLNSGGTEYLVPAITPSNATNQNVTWASSNTSAATVSSGGLVTAVAAGSATITVTTVDGNRTATCAVTVTVPVAPPDSTIYTFSNNRDFKAWLDAQPNNTKTTPYNVKLNISETLWSQVIGGPGNTLQNNAAKYVSLDLSGSTFTIVENYAFVNCSSLTSVTLPDGVTGIGTTAFLNCSSLASVNMPDNVTIISNLAFKGCTSLTDITIPSSVIHIGNGVFGGCTSLASINVASDNKEYTAENGILLTYSSDGRNKSPNKDMLVAYPAGRVGSSPVIPNSVTRISPGAFNGCTNLTSVTIPDSVTSIGQKAFMDCTNLASVIIGSHVASIGASAFGEGSNLTSVTFKGTIDSNSFRYDVFTGDLRAKYLAGGPGTYTRASGGATWTKQ